MWKLFFLLLFTSKNLSAIPDSNTNMRFKMKKNIQYDQYPISDKHRLWQQFVSLESRANSFYDAINIIVSSLLAYFISFSIFLNLIEFFAFAASTFFMLCIILDLPKDSFCKLIVEFVERFGDFLLKLQAEMMLCVHHKQKNLLYSNIVLLLSRSIDWMKNNLKENLRPGKWLVYMCRPNSIIQKLTWFLFR